jgi:arylsulfatase
MRIFDTLSTTDASVTIIDVRAGLLSPTLRSLRDIGFLDAVKKGQLTFIVFHILGSSIASLNEIEDTSAFAADGKYFLVKNFINNTSFFEWDEATYSSYFKKLKDAGLEQDTIVVFTTDNGAENFTWPDGGQTPFAGGKGTVLEGGFRAPCIARWPGKIPAGKVENGIMSGLDWFPTLVAAAGNPNIVDELKKGKQLGDRTYKVHLDGYDQTDLITGKGPSKRREIFYFAEGTLGAIRVGDYKYRFIDQPGGWLGGTVKVDWPILTNLRLDPFERTNLSGSLAFYNWYAYEFWRFVLVQEVVAMAAQSFVEFPPVQKGASFNIEGVKEQVQKAIASHSGS